MARVRSSKTVTAGERHEKNLNKRTGRRVRSRPFLFYSAHLITFTAIFSVRPCARDASDKGRPIRAAGIDCSRRDAAAGHFKARDVTPDNNKSEAAGRVARRPAHVRQRADGRATRLTSTKEPETCGPVSLCHNVAQSNRIELSGLTHARRWPRKKRGARSMTRRARYVFLVDRCTLVAGELTKHCATRATQRIGHGTGTEQATQWNWAAETWRACAFGIRGSNRVRQ